MNKVFGKSLDHFCTVQLGYILIYLSPTYNHLQHIVWVMSKLRYNSLFAKPTKCKLGPTYLEYLGHIISSGTIKPDLNRAQTIQQQAFLNNKLYFQVFLAFSKQYGRFARYFTDLAAPLYTLLFREATWHWINTKESAMHYLCTELYSHLVLTLLDFTTILNLK